jgi:hypothetical protein
VQRTGSAVLRERKSAIENIFGDDADSPLGVRPAASATVGSRYSANPNFVGQVDVVAAKAGAASADDACSEEQLYIEQLRRRLSRLSTCEVDEDTPIRRERLPSLCLDKDVARPLGQAAGSQAPDSSEAAGALIRKHVSSSVKQITQTTPAVEAVSSAARTFLRGPGGAQLRQRAMTVAVQPVTTTSDTAAESSTVTIAALAELRKIAVSIMTQAVAQVASQPSDQSESASQERSSLVSKITPRKRKHQAAQSTARAQQETRTGGAALLSEMEEMQAMDEVLAVLVPEEVLSSLFDCLKRTPSMSDAVWKRAASRFAKASTEDTIDLSPVVQELEQMALHLHAPGQMLGMLLSAVKALYGAAEDGVSADELLPLFIGAVARCEGSNLAALQRFVEELGHFSPCGEAARYLTDLCAAVAHILAEDGRAVVEEWLLAHDVEPDEVTAFIGEGYSGDGCVRELEQLSAEQLEALVDELTGAQE